MATLDIIALSDASHRPAEGGLCGAGVVLIDRRTMQTIAAHAIALPKMDSGRAEEKALIIALERSIGHGANIIELRSDSEGALNGKQLAARIRRAGLEVRLTKATRQQVAYAHGLAGYAVRRQINGLFPHHGDGWQMVPIPKRWFIAREALG